MRSVGKVMSFSATGAIVIRSDSAPRIGGKVCDMRGREIGRIIRVTGPVARPYTIVKPLKDLPDGMNRLIGRELYLSEMPEKRSTVSHVRRDERKPRAGNDPPRSKSYGKRSGAAPNKRQDRRSKWNPRG
ncbi:MAG: Gar1/Naf1 family protein [Candidatus Thermoplasmatota archaeon]|nr:Gar1/Naf1 family protein [Candidatus Thermoplasmatota archaeon]